jgi:GntR family transcriptional regulator, transcriptional repressor for pyruvate dehydrogenase complex
MAEEGREQLHEPVRMKRPVRQLKRSESIARLLVDRITSSRLKDGDSLESEIVMMEELNTGRGSLREAFRILELSGILEVRTGPTGGPIVRDPDISHFAGMWSLFLRMNGGTYRELMEANIITEPPIAAIGAERRNPEHIAVLQAAVDREAAIPVEDGHAYMAANAEFHDAVARMADNRALYLYLRGNHWISSILWGDVVAVGEVQGEVHEAHKHVLKAIVDGNPKRAEAVLRKHLEMSMDYCERRFGSMLDQPVRWH